MRKLHAKTFISNKLWGRPILPKDLYYRISGGVNIDNHNQMFHLTEGDVCFADLARAPEGFDVQQAFGTANTISFVFLLLFSPPIDYL